MHCAAATGRILHKITGRILGNSEALQFEDFETVWTHFDISTETLDVVLIRLLSLCLKSVVY